MGKQTMPRKLIDKPYNGNTWSRARYFGFIRSGLRRMSLRWGPKSECLRAARRPSKSANKRLKWEVRCGKCGGWFAGKDVAVHHKTECGTLRAYTDLPGFVERLFCEVGGFIVLCTGCHAKEHK